MPHSIGSKSSHRVLPRVVWQGRTHSSSRVNNSQLLLLARVLSDYTTSFSTIQIIRLPLGIIIMCVREISTNILGSTCWQSNSAQALQRFEDYDLAFEVGTRPGTWMKIHELWRYLNLLSYYPKFHFPSQSHPERLLQTMGPIYPLW